MNNATVELDLTGPLLDGFNIETLQPQPLCAISAGQGMKLWVQTDAQGQANFYLTLRGDGLGLFRSRIARRHARESGAICFPLGELWTRYYARPRCICPCFSCLGSTQK